MIVGRDIREWPAPGWSRPLFHVMSNDDADAAFNALHDAQATAQMLYMDLRDAGDDSGAANARVRAKLLQDEIDALMNKELDDWQKGAEAMIPQLSTATEAAQKAVGQVANNIKNAQNVVAAINAIDKAISVAIKLLA